MRRINFDNLLLIHLQFDKLNTSHFISSSELLCEKMITESYVNQGNDIRCKKINIVNKIFCNKNEITNSILFENIKGIISPVNHDLLVTIFYNGHFFEVACKAIVTNFKERKFILCDLITIDKNMFPLHELEIIKWLVNPTCWEKLVNDSKYLDREEISNIVVNKIVSIACHSVYDGTYTYNSNDPNVEKIKNAYNSCYIHSIEVLNNSKNKFKTIRQFIPPSDHELSFFEIWSNIKCRPYSDFEINYNFEAKSIMLSSMHKETFLKRDSDFRSYFNEETEEYILKAKKSFNTRYEMKNFIIEIENDFIKNNIITAFTQNLDTLDYYTYNVFCDDIFTILNKRLQFVESKPFDISSPANHNIRDSYDEFVSWFKKPFIPY
ncbi:hypothetical protein LX69_00586 [Breznakibacter xylanolyticus]|uniref:Uncharacterized protein n=1 Tax=Breznakibacter xylanolyticus TaxID=990 RepID=A0A2W7NKX7_9BACT|nr:hypothetical protein [Breznakibacter xylanolyticus]PZX20133.1 hypothetical protein LX69_00586 [Breznakibacter xylanolyticus]